jgi:hypothetical protein
MMRNIFWHSYYSISEQPQKLPVILIIDKLKVKIRSLLKKPKELNTR